MKVTIVIAAFNEGKSISKVLHDLRKEGYSDIVVVDDGSSDDTALAAERSGATVLSHIINRGQGAALKTGIDYAVSKRSDIIVTYDADGQFLPSEIRTMILPIERKECDVTLGSRFLGKAENIPLLKKLVLKLGIVFVYFLYGINVTDSQNGFRAMSRHAAERIEINSNRMEHAGEILHEIKRKELRFKEMPVTVLYTDYSMRKGQSWTKSISLGLKMIFKQLMR